MGYSHPSSLNQSFSLEPVFINHVRICFANSRGSFIKSMCPLLVTPWNARKCAGIWMLENVWFSDFHRHARCFLFTSSCLFKYLISLYTKISHMHYCIELSFSARLMYILYIPYRIGCFVERNFFNVFFL